MPNVHPPTIRGLRLQARLTTLQIEERTGGIAKRAWLNAIERGSVPSPAYERVTALAQALGISSEACFTAIAASVAARATRQTGGKGRPARRPARVMPSVAEALTIARTAAATLRQVVNHLERLARAS